MKLLEIALFSTVITVIVGITLFLNGMYDPIIPIVFAWFISTILCIVLLVVGDMFYEYPVSYKAKYERVLELYEMLMEED